ncbi:FecR domain-containing protein [Adhaeribacter soli]|uniref:DUF4974 domain-containing protein n=1 Tax=Adhaeribacter soli TaxID=2607655 RepID=A0A5N1J1K1_9BACT|nr:FecR domain-containing protein [Adhaeribacter soli]KAA9340663.1 DUF4974 domain-containing protein [Adhaeribacter soli]
MRTIRFFITGVLCLIFSMQTLLAQNLNTKVSLQVKDATLPQVLQQIQKKYGYRFSYLNNELPAKTRFSAEVKDKPLSEVLDVLLEKTDMGYKQVNGQIIIKKGFPKNKPKATTFQKLPTSITENKASQTAKTVTHPQPENQATAKETTAKETLAKETSAKETSVKETSATTTNSGTVNTATPETQPEQAAEKATELEVKSAVPAGENVSETSAANPAEEKKETILDKLRATRLNNEVRASNSDSILYTDTHLGIIFPISTNGTAANRYVNRTSVHLLAGTSAALEGVEFAGFGNLEQGYVKGVQFSGFFNVVKHRADLRELAATRNEGYAVQGGQFGSFINFAGGNIKGGQFAGYMNVTEGHINGGQFAGFLNIAKNVNGAQGAGYMNLAKNVDGAQLAGFLNIADTVSGVQAAGFLNIARCAKGTQIAFINIADSAAGVPIGVFNFVNKGGYKRAEFYAADDFDANFTFKIGVPKFHTLLALGAELNDKHRWGYGFGFGSEWAMSKRLKLNTDILSYYVVEESYKNIPDGLYEDYELNLLNKFRLLGTIQLAKRFAIFGGPTYNVSVSRYQEKGSENVGSTLANNTFYNHTSKNGTNVKMWIGFNAGLRF